MRVPELEHVLHHGTAPILGYKVHRAVAKKIFHLVCSFKLPCRSWFGSSALISPRATSQERWARMWLAKGTARQWLLQAGLWRQRFFLASSLSIEVEDGSMLSYDFLCLRLHRLKTMKNLGMQMTRAHFVRSPSQKSSCANHPALRWATRS